MQRVLVCCALPLVVVGEGEGEQFGGRLYHWEVWWRYQRHEAQSLDTRQGWAARHALEEHQQLLHMSEGGAAAYEGEGGHYEQAGVGPEAVLTLPAYQVGRRRLDQSLQLG